MNNNSEISLIDKLKNRIVIFRENNPSAFVFVMIVLINILSVVVSSALLLFLPENKDRNFLEMMYFAFTLMVNPSGRYQYSDYPVSLIVTTVVVLIGMISLTGGTVGYITSIINNIVRKSATSKRKLKIEKHIAILNYNHKVPALIYDYSFDDMDNTYIVILTEKDKEQIEKSINNVFVSQNVKNKFKNLIIRTGNPMSKYDLDNISLDTAKTVLIMNPEEGIAENKDSFAVAKLFMFIKWYLSKGKKDFNTNVIIESNGKEIEEMIRDYKDDNTNNLWIPANVNEVLGKIMAMTVINPQLNSVIMHLISFKGVEIYIEDIPELSIADEMLLQKTVIPIFDIYDENQHPYKRVYISEVESELNNRNKEKFILKKPLPKEKLIPNVRFDKSEIVIVGINNKLAYILESLCCLTNEYPEIDIRVTLMDTSEHEKILNDYCSDAKYAAILNKEPIIIKSIYKPFDNIDRSFVQNIHSVLLLSDESNNSDHIDEKPLLFWNNIEKIKSGECIVEILDMQNKDICNNEQTIVSDNFISCMFAQLGKQPKRLDVIKDILTFQDDSSSVSADDQPVNQCTIFSIKAGAFFCSLSEIPEFTSKREMIVWIYEATGKVYLPIGCIKNGINFLFSRTDGKSDDLDTCILRSEEDGKDAVIINEGSVKLSPNDEIIVLKYTPNT